MLYKFLKFIKNKFLEIPNNKKMKYNYLKGQSFIDWG